jgi:uncharacterized membrane protein
MTTDVFTPKVKLEHVISFSDAVFAFAITLMAISIDIPDLPTNLTQSQLVGKLYEMYPQVESYLISFAVIAIFWVSYHQVFNHIMGSPIQIVYLNLLFLMLITLLSLSTSYQIPYIVYCTIVIMTSSLLAVIWWYATRDHKLINKSIHPLFVNGVMVNLLSIPAVFSLSIFVSFIDLNIAQYIWLGIVPLNIVIRKKYKH